jgi:hypothetical protein
MLGRLGSLAEPQRRGLSNAFGLAPGDNPDRFLVALAALSLMAEAAEGRPLLCVVDDAQWLDQASARVLGFVARRLLAESVALVLAARTPSGDDSSLDHLAGLPGLQLEGLADEPGRADSAGGGDRPAGPGRADQPGDRRAAVHRSPHGGMAPAQGVRQAGHRLPARTG